MTCFKRIAWFALASLMLVLTGCHHHRGYHYYNNAPGYSPYYGSQYGYSGRPYYQGHGHHHHDDWD